MIDWTKVQRALTRAGYDAGVPDGADGPLTYTALFAAAAGRQPDTTIMALGRAAATWLADPHNRDPITLTPQRLAEFLAQCANETGGFTRFVENLSYSAAQILATWPTRFATITQARLYERQPKALANKVYGGRMGNTGPDDGWRYRGRGMLQLTGRANYERFGTSTGLDLLVQPELAADPATSLVIAREFWREARVNEAIDLGDYLEARKRTNGGAIGLEAVAARRARLLMVFR